jgi:hypothetical protein
VGTKDTTHQRGNERVFNICVVIVGTFHSCLVPDARCLLLVVLLVLLCLVLLGAVACVLVCLCACVLVCLCACVSVQEEAEARQKVHTAHRL